MMRHNDEQSDHDANTKNKWLTLSDFLENSVLVSNPDGRPPLSSSLKLTPRG